jgi:hypothetical protein
MPQQTKTFRVFVSSTFTDMKEERRKLQRDVFPKLEQFCNEKGAKFQAVDLRWGINEKTQLNQKTLQTCLNEVARCQKLSPKPNFLILLGDKYGWQPIPEKIPADEMEQILPKLYEEDKKVIYWSDDEEFYRGWYRKDTNAVPAKFILRDKTNTEYEQYDAWEPIEKRIRKALRDAVNKLNWEDKKRIKYFTSATHQEIINGVFTTPENIEDPGKHVFSFERKVENMPSDSSADGFIDLDENKNWDAYSISQLNRLKYGKNGKPEDKEWETGLRAQLGENYHVYKGTWDKSEKKVKIDELEKFTDDVYSALHGIIEEQIKHVIDKDEIKQEVNLHENFKKQLVKHFKGREKIITEIEEKLEQKSDNKPLALIGESGSGKSSVMAKVVQNKSGKGENSQIVYRFIGATSGSTNLISLLQSVSGQIAKAYATTIEALAGEGNEKNLHEIYGISEVFKKSLALATPEKPLVVFLDALDQLADKQEQQNFYWLPEELPENTKLVVSALKELEHVLTAPVKIELPKLPPKEAKDILDGWLENIDRQLTADQEKVVLQNNDKELLPIYLKLAFEQAKKWESFKTEVALKPDVPGIINDFIDSLSQEHGGEFVQDVICLMLCGRYKGLAENEILEIFAFDENGKDGLWDKFLKTSHKDHRQELMDMKEELKGSMKIPIAVWSRLIPRFGTIFNRTRCRWDTHYYIFPPAV